MAKIIISRRVEYLFIGNDRIAEQLTRLQDLLHLDRVQNQRLLIDDRDASRKVSWHCDGDIASSEALDTHGLGGSDTSMMSQYAEEATWVCPKRVCSPNQKMPLGEVMSCNPFDVFQTDEEPDTDQEVPDCHDPRSGAETETLTRRRRRRRAPKGNEDNSLVEMPSPCVRERKPCKVIEVSAMPCLNESQECMQQGSLQKDSLPYEGLWRDDQVLCEGTLQGDSLQETTVSAARDYETVRDRDRREVESLPESLCNNVRQEGMSQEGLMRRSCEAMVQSRDKPDRQTWMLQQLRECDRHNYTAFVVEHQAELKSCPILRSALIQKGNLLSYQEGARSPQEWATRCKVWFEVLGRPLKENGSFVRDEKSNHRGGQERP